MLVITGGLVHSVSAARGEQRDIVVEDDVIADIVAPGAVRNANAKVIDASRRLIIPGLINAHIRRRRPRCCRTTDKANKFPPPCMSGKQHIEG